MSAFSETVLEIDLQAVTHNFKYIKSRLNPKTKVLAVVKAFAYGSDAQEIAKHLETLQADYFAVAYVKEGVALRKAGVTLPILVLHCQPINFKLLIKHCLEPSIYSMRVLKEFITIAKQEKQTNHPIHIKFNTGLNRLGFSLEEVSQIVLSLKTAKNIKVASIFSHLAASDDLDERQFTLQQIKDFKKAAISLKNGLEYQPFLHLCNTSGILNYPNAHFDMVRSGIGLYGFSNNPEIDKHLKPISTLKTCISQIHYLKKGDYLGYNLAFKAEKDVKTATLPIGHADGINRAFGNKKGFIYINNQKAYIIGNVCMDMIMVDVTGIDCNEGDEVIIFDKNNKASLLSKKVNSISYELITSVSQRIKRTFNR